MTFTECAAYLIKIASFSFVCVFGQDIFNE